MAELEADFRLRIARGQKSTIRFHAATCSSFHMPVQPGLIRPSGETQVISVNTQPGAAHRALAVMDEVEVVGRAVDRRIHRHRRDGDAVLEAISRSLNGANIGGAALSGTPLGRAFPEPALDAFEPFAVAQAQILVADALAARQQRISELQRLEVQVAVAASRTIRSSCARCSGASALRGCARPDIRRARLRG